MIDFILNNLSTIIVGLIVAVIIAVSLYFTIKGRKNGGCGCGCDNCPSKCNKKDKK